MLEHPLIDLLELLNKYDWNPVGLHRELGLSLRTLYRNLNILEKAGLIGFKRFSRYPLYITEKGREILSRISAK